MRRAQVVTAACAALLWTSVAAAQTPGGAGSSQGGGSQAGSAAGISTSTSGVEDRGPGLADRTTARSDSDKDVRKFVERAAMADMAAGQLGRLALQQAQHPQVKQFAQQMVDEHARSLEQLRSLADSLNIQLASSLDGKHRKRHDTLAKIQGAEFDRAYLDAMVDAHEDAERLLAKRASDPVSRSSQGMPGASAMSSVGTPDSTGAVGTSGTTGTSGSVSASTSAVAPASIDDWAAMTLPKVRMHLEHARSLEDQIESAGRSNDATSGNDSVPAAYDPARAPESRDGDKAPAGATPGSHDPNSSDPPQS